MDFNKLASEESLNKTKKSLEEKGYNVHMTENKEKAMEMIKELIPPGASVMNGSSVTLEQVGLVDYLKEGKHGWNNLHEAILTEEDKDKRSQLRKQALLSEYYLGSVHAMAEDGQFIIASNTGSQLPHVVYSSKNLIFVLSTKKIVPTLTDCFKRLEEHVVPLEDEHMKNLYGSGTALNKIIVFKGESKSTARKINIILVKEDLGF